MFIPTTQAEVKNLGWDSLDIILITGDSYIDSPLIGTAVIGKVLINEGYRVGIIAQPDIKSEKDIKRLGEPKLFWGVTGGCVDSMLANYTATKKRRNRCDYTPGGQNNRRPDRAVIKYSNLIQQHFKNTKPILLGGIEASLRRISHYDYWSNNIRKSILFDSKADYLIYGMGERAIMDFANSLRDGGNPETIRGLCYKSNEPVEDYFQLPAHDEVTADKNQFVKMFDKFYKNNDPLNARGLCQKQDSRYLIQNPPAFRLNTSELDRIYELSYERKHHPYYQKQGSVKALETIEFSFTTHRGCYGECNFCSIATHQGRTIQSRSQKSLVKEVEWLSRMDSFKGSVYSAGAPTANMYGFECSKKLNKGSCKNKRCLFPTVCKDLKITHRPQIGLHQKLSQVKGVKNVFVTSGLRYDMVVNDEQHGRRYLNDLVSNHISGQLKIAPEHCDESVLKLMGKPERGGLETFNDMFYRATKSARKNQFLTYYLIAAHPGCSENEMINLKEFTTDKLKINPEQVQVYIPLPSTYSALMFYTGIDPETGKKIFVEKDNGKKEKQKSILVGKKDKKPAYTPKYQRRRGSKR